MKRKLAFVAFLFLANMGRADDVPEPGAIIDKAIKAQGGAEKLAAVKAEMWKTRGIRSIGSSTHTVTEERFVNGFDKSRYVQVFTETGQRTVIIVNGKQASITVTNGGQTLGYKVDKYWKAEEIEQNYSRGYRHCSHSPPGKKVSN